MSEPDKKQIDKTKLPCQWVEEEGFDLTLAAQSPLDPPALSDTAFLLKNRPLPQPPQFPMP